MLEMNHDLFINPGFNLQKGDNDLLTVAKLPKEQLRARWNTQTGKFILSKWKANGFDRKVLDELVGKYYDHTDIRGISVVGEDLSKVDLSKVDLCGSNLLNANFNEANLIDSWISESNIRGAKFNWAKMDNALLDNVEFDNRTSFVGVNLNAINFTLAALLQDLAVGQQRIVHLEKRHPILATFLRVTCDYGRSFTRFAIWCVSVVLVFGVIYNLIPNAISKPGLGNSIYFSLMTFITLGSDINVMSDLGKILTVIEATSGYIMTGLLIAILVRRTIGE